MLYKITIVEVTEQERETKDYQKLHDKQEFDNDKEPQYGYVRHKEVYTKATEIYIQQTNKNINLKGIIDAFNMFRVE